MVESVGATLTLTVQWPRVALLYAGWQLLNPRYCKYSTQRFWTANSRLRLVQHEQSALHLVVKSAAIRTEAMLMHRKACYDSASVIFISFTNEITIRQSRIIKAAVQ